MIPTLEAFTQNMADFLQIEMGSNTDVFHTSITADPSVYTGFLIIARRSLYNPGKYSKVDRMVSIAYSNDWSLKDWQFFEYLCKENL